MQMRTSVGPGYHIIVIDNIIVVVVVVVDVDVVIVARVLQVMWIRSALYKRRRVQ